MPLLDSGQIGSRPNDLPGNDYATPLTRSSGTYNIVPQIAQHWPSPSRIRPMFFEVVPDTWSEVGPKLVRFGPHSVDFDRFRPKFEQLRPGFGQSVISTAICPRVGQTMGQVSENLRGLPSGTLLAQRSARRVCACPQAPRRSSALKRLGISPLLRSPEVSSRKFSLAICVSASKKHTSRSRDRTRLGPAPHRKPRSHLAVSDDLHPTRTHGGDLAGLRCR